MYMPTATLAPGGTANSFGAVQVRVTGPSGVAMETVEEGWYVGGVALPRDRGAEAVAREPSTTVGR